jgi:hypothetical protein
LLFHWLLSAVDLALVEAALDTKSKGIGDLRRVCEKFEFKIDGRYTYAFGDPNGLINPDITKDDISHVWGKSED